MKSERTNTILLLIFGVCALRSWWLQEFQAKREPDSVLTKWTDPTFGGERHFLMFQQADETDEQFAVRVLIRSLAMKQTLEQGR